MHKEYVNQLSCFIEQYVKIIHIMTGSNINLVYIKQALSSLLEDVIFFETIDSTNRYLKEHHAQYASKTLVIAQHQSQGQGRHQRRFHSAKGKGIYMSLLLKHEHISSFAAMSVPVAIIQAIKTCLNLEAQIKWPNDIYLQDKKLAGVLIETQQATQATEDDFMIIGIGINLYEQDFPEDVQKTAAALQMFTSQVIHYDDILISLIRSLDDYLDQKDEVIRIYRQHLYKKNQWVEVLNDQIFYEAMIIDISSEGHLLVKSKDGRIHQLVSSEIRIKI
jgi:BirA family transcriptional regulator, biotin operon repressor / biotin---[acetyl-CoA-carboxylase] ligase